MRARRVAPTPGGGAAPAPSARSALRNRNFRLFFTGNLVSQSGTLLQNAAQAVLIHDLTGRNVAVGLTNAFTFMPVLVLALVGGDLADRMSRRLLFVLTQVASLAAVLALAVVTGVGAVTPTWIYATAAVLGVAYAIAIPTMHALVPSLVPARDLGPALGLTAVTFNLARVLGPLLAAAALAGLGFALAFGLNGLTFAVFIVALLALRFERRPRDRPRSTIREGFRYAWRDRPTRAMLLGVTALAFALDPVNTLTPSFATAVFGRTGAAAPLLISAFGVGGALVAFMLGRMFREGAPSPRRAAATLATMGVGMTAFALSPSFHLALAFLLVAGMGSLASVTLFTTVIQQRVPDVLRGRVMGLWTLAALGTRFPAGVVDGLLGDAFGARAATLLALVPLALAVVAILRLAPASARAGGEPPEFAAPP